ncbi:MAG: hypothetical protein ABIG44_00705 [Planctomycetota bacterium]
MELVRGYVAGTLDPHTHARWAAHLRRCAECRDLVEQQRSWTGVLKLGDETPKLDGAIDRLLDNVELPGQPLSAWQRWRGFLPGLLLAILLGIAAGTAWRLATTPSAAERHAETLNITRQLQQEIVLRLDALQTLRRDPWLADDFETVRWLDELIVTDGGEQ